MTLKPSIVCAPRQLWAAAAAAAAAAGERRAVTPSEAMWAAGAVAAAVLLVAMWLACVRGAPVAATHVGIPKARGGADVDHVVVVIAHPDDEAMFMTPCLVAFAQLGYRLNVLCLSNGNADGLGRLREKELVRSLGSFGIAAGDVTVLDDPRLQDGMAINWPVGYTAAVIRDHCAAVAGGGGRVAVLTFDDYGVSGHLNHRATSHAVLAALQETRSPVDAVYQVVSHAVWFKFTGFLGSLVPSRTGVGARVGSPWTCLDAMRCHASQMVWYRWLFIAFSRYTFAVDLEVRRR